MNHNLEITLNPNNDGYFLHGGRHGSDVSKFWFERKPVATGRRTAHLLNVTSSLRARGAMLFHRS